MEVVGGNGSAQEGGREVAEGLSVNECIYVVKCGVIGKRAARKVNDEVWERAKCEECFWEK